MPAPNTSQHKFTQAELEQAFSQMSAERDRERLEAGLAADCLAGKLGAHVTVGYRDQWMAYHGPSTSPYPDQHCLVVIYETYGPHKEGLIAALQTTPGVTILPGSFEIHDNCDAFEWDVSNEPSLPGLTNRMFKGRFEYFDNHCTGY